MKYWEMVKVDITDVLGDFCLISKFVKLVNSTFLVLIPKFEGAMKLMGFRLIS